MLHDDDDGFKSLLALSIVFSYVNDHSLLPVAFFGNLKLEVQFSS